LKTVNNHSGNDIPMWLVMLMLFTAPPIGVILLIIRTIWSASDNKASSTEAKKKKKSRSIGSGTRFILNLISVIALVTGIGGIYEAFGDPAWSMSLLSVAGLMIPFAVSGGAFALSSFHKGRAERCDRYGVLIGDNPYFSLSALAAASGVSVRRVNKDLQYMINNGKFGQSAFIDLGKKMYFASPEAANEYENAFARVRVEDERQASDKVPRDEYREIILEIRRLNDEIADIAVSDRIYKLEEICENIFSYVKEHPEKRSSIRMLMNYYLPTTLKLLTSYANIERVGVAGDNMRKSKQSIEETLDMLV